MQASLLDRGISQSRESLNLETPGKKHKGGNLQAQAPLPSNQLVPSLALLGKSTEPHTPLCFSLPGCAKSPFFVWKVYRVDFTTLSWSSPLGRQFARFCEIFTSRKFKFPPLKQPHAKGTPIPKVLSVKGTYYVVPSVWDCRAGIQVGRTFRVDFER